MSTLQQQIKDAVKAVSITGTVEFRGHQGLPNSNKKCISISGTYGECMLIISHVIKEMAAALSEVAATGSPEARADTELLFNQNVDILLGYNIEPVGGRYSSKYTVYWPMLEPINT